MMRITVVLLVLGTLAAAQDHSPPPRRPLVTASGEATISVQPDQARLNVGVVTQAVKAEDAGAQNALGTAAVIAELRGLLGSGADIHTTNYSLNPGYRYPQNGSPTITGYTASNVVQVRIDDLKMVGKVIDSVTQSGANTINGIQFNLRDEQAVRTEALKQAAVKARANAEAIAAALGVRVVGLASAEASDLQVPRPMMAMARASAKAAMAPTPVEPGSIEVHAQVQVTLEVAP
jgi:uncharacterized protein